MRRWAWEPSEKGSLVTGMPKRVEFLASPYHTQSSLWLHKMRTCCRSHRVELWSSWPLTAAVLRGLGCYVTSWMVVSERQEWVGHMKTGSFSAPCTTRAVVDKCFHLAGLWFITVVVRVHTSCCYCISKMLSLLPGREQEIIIIAWCVFLIQCRPRVFMSPALGLQ